MSNPPFPVLASSVKLPFCALLIAGLAACGGGSTSTSGDTTPSTLAFPTGIAVTSPSALGDTSSVVASLSMPIPLGARMVDWGHAMWQALSKRDAHTVGILMARLMPIGQATASTLKVPEGLVVASEIEAVAKGTLPLSTAGLLELPKLFDSNAVNAQCFGPAITYANHDDFVSGMPAATGRLPGGDLGMWLDLEPGTSKPCATAELDTRLGSVKGQFRQAMLLMASLRRTVATSSLSLPTASHSTDVTSAMGTVLAAIPAASGITVNTATVSLDSDGAIYTYRLVLSTGSGATAKSGEIIIAHAPGISDEVFSGVVQITAAQLGNDPAFNCTDEVDSGTSLNKLAAATTISYIRNGSQLFVDARAANYCGGPASSSISHINDIASLTIKGELDLGIDLSGNNVRSSINGWRGNASRFAATVNLDSQAGDFLYVWQAGNMDDHARAFAVHSAYNSSTEARALQAYYAYTNTIGSTDGTLLGMICNWAGPGNDHTPQTVFQSQSATLSSSANAWSLDTGGSKIAYAPTNTCDASSGMTFDANADHTIDSGEGANTTNTLDRLSTGMADIEHELAARDYAIPSLF